VRIAAADSNAAKLKTGESLRSYITPSGIELDGIRLAVFVVE